jgi:hypothetical protein
MSQGNKQKIRKGIIKTAYSQMWKPKDSANKLKEERKKKKKSQI